MKDQTLNAAFISFNQGASETPAKTFSKQQRKHDHQLYWYLYSIHNLRKHLTKALFIEIGTSCCEDFEQ